MGYKKEDVELAAKQLQAVYGDLSRAKGLEGIFSAVARSVKKVEELSKTLDIKGPQKRAFCCDLLFELVELPWYLPKPLVRLFLNFAINKAVKKYNEFRKK